MKIEPLSLSGAVRIVPDVHADSRGFFVEAYRKDAYAALGVTADFVQDNHSHSVRNVVRGIKFQYDAPMDKLFRVAHGEVFAVAVDLRPNSPTFGKWESVVLSGENQVQLYMPFGFGFGFCVTSEEADVIYKVSAYHNQAGSGTIRFDDPDLAITWPTKTPIVSEGDKVAPLFSEWKESEAAKRMP